MRVSPHDTTVCRIYQAERLRNSVLRDHIQNPLPPLTSPMGNVVKNAVHIPPNPKHEDMPGLTQPLNITQGRESFWVLDSRPYMRWEQRTDSYRLTAENDYVFQVVRLALTEVAQLKGGAAFGRLGDVAIKTFVRWITLGIGQRYNLAIEHQANVSVIVAYYYYTQLQDSLQLDVTSRHRLANPISRITSVPVPAVLEIADQLGSLKDGADLVNAMATLGGSLRLNNIKYADLYTMLSSSWMGVNARENVGVAIEHIPTFVAMVFNALADRSYRKTVISRRAETTGRQQDIKDFTLQVQRLVESRYVS